MALPELPEAIFMQAIEELVKIDRAWIPGGEGSLYLRPFMIATEAFLGVTVLRISSADRQPVGSYFKGGAGRSLGVGELHARREGGTGEAKCGGNYAASLLAQAEAIEQGCDQVVFLDAAEHRYVEELGGMNVFFVFDDGSMVTPPLAARSCPASPGIRSSRSPRKPARSARSATASSNGAPMRPAASCARLSPAVRPRWSRRSAR